jgi:hypothetical protein
MLVLLRSTSLSLSSRRVRLLGIRLWVALAGALPGALLAQGLFPDDGWTPALIGGLCTGALFARGLGPAPGPDDDGQPGELRSA